MEKTSGQISGDLEASKPKKGDFVTGEPALDVPREGEQAPCEQVQCEPAQGEQAPCEQEPCEEAQCEPAQGESTGTPSAPAIDYAAARRAASLAVIEEAHALFDALEFPVDERFMKLALEQARFAGALKEVPIGAVVVYNGEVVASAFNRREIDADPAAHAEFLAIKEASRVLGRWRLTGCTVYVTLEPCIMCAGLMHQARVDRCVYGAPDPKAGALGTLYSIHEDKRLNHTFEVTAGVCEDECSALLREFFLSLRKGPRKRSSEASEDNPREEPES